MLLATVFILFLLSCISSLVALFCMYITYFVVFFGYAGCRDTRSSSSSFISLSSSSHAYLRSDQTFLFLLFLLYLDSWCICFRIRFSFGSCCFVAPIVTFFFFLKKPYLRSSSFSRFITQTPPSKYLHTRPSLSVCFVLFA